MDKDFREQFIRNYTKRLAKYNDWKSPPWAKRKNQEIVRSIAHPELQRDLSILQRCRPKSIMAIHSVLIEYFVKTYGISVEMAESWVLYMVTRDINVIFPRTQIDGVRLFNDDLKIAGPSKDKKRSYKILQSDVKRKDAHMNIRIGRSATKQDVLWLVERYWDTEIAPQIKTSYQAPDQQRKPKLLRNSIIYALHKEGMKVREIKKYVEDTFDEVVEESIIRKIPKEFKPPRDWFAPAFETLQALPDEQKASATFKITFKVKPEPHFQIV